MSYAIALPVSRYGLAGFLSLLMTLLIFLALFETIKAPIVTVIILPQVRPPAYKPLVPPPPPQEPVDIKKPVFNSGGKTRVILPPTITTAPPDHDAPWTNRPTIDVDTGTGGALPTSLEGEVMEIVLIPPAYPISAETRGIEGYVVVEYSVTTYGTASDIRVIEAMPEQIFNQSSIDAVAKFKFKPRVVNGAPVESRGLRKKFIFQLNN